MGDIEREQAEHMGRMDLIREVEHLRRVVDSVRSRTALDVVAEKMAAEDKLRGSVEALERIDREARAIVLNDNDAQARHQRIADIAADYFHHGGR